MSDFEKAVFCIESIPNVQFQGYHNGTDWNGFACPYFERQVAEKILKASEENGFVWSYNLDMDSFEVRSSMDPVNYEPEMFAAQEISINRESIKVYPIGAYSWIWGLCEQ